MKDQVDKSWVCVHMRPNSDVVQVTSNLADKRVAEMYAENLEEIGGRVIAIFGMAAQVPHYYAHNPGRANIIIRGLQATGIFISPNHHGAHHTGLYDRNFCIVSNWNNWWFNWLVGAK